MDEQAAVRLNPNKDPPPRSANSNAMSSRTWATDELEYPDMQANLEEVDEIIDDHNSPWKRMREGHKRRQKAQSATVRRVQPQLPLFGRQ